MDLVVRYEIQQSGVRLVDSRTVQLKESDLTPEKLQLTVV